MRLLVRAGADLEAQTAGGGGGGGGARVRGWHGSSSGRRTFGTDQDKHTVHCPARISFSPTHALAFTSHAQVGSTPLCLAAGAGNVPVVRALLAAGARVDAPNQVCVRVRERVCVCMCVCVCVCVCV